MTVMDIKRKKQALALKSLYYFDKKVLGYDKMEDNPHLELTKYIQDVKKRKKLILMPRGSFKSSVVTIGYSLHSIVRNPDIRILIASEKLSNAKRFLSSIKDHIVYNKEFIELFGELDPKDKRDGVWNQDEIVVNTREKMHLKEPTVSTAGIDVAQVGMHYDLIIVDDPVSNNNVGTKDQIEKTINWYKSMLSILQPDGDIILIGTRWDYDDLYGHILDNPELRENYSTFIKQAVDKSGKLLMPEVLSKEFLEEQKVEQGPYIYSSQYMNDPVASEDATFRRKWFKYYTPDDLDDRVLIKYTMVDPAYSEEEENDQTAIVTVGLDKFANIYILDVRAFRKALPSDIIFEIFQVLEKYQPRKWGLEQVVFKESLSFEFGIKNREEGRNFKLPEELKPGRRSKDERIRGLQPLYASGRIFHKKSNEMTAELEYQLTHYPKTRHDDIIDALAFLKDIAVIEKPVQSKNSVPKVLLEPTSKLTGY